MKKDIHPELKEAVIKCACGAEYRTLSVKGSYNIEICSACHPFFTGREKLLDTEGRVKKFRRRYKIKES